MARSRFVRNRVGRHHRLLLRGHGTAPRRVFDGAYTQDGVGNWLGMNQINAQRGFTTQTSCVQPNGVPLTPDQLLRRPATDPFLVDVTAYTDFYRVRASLFNTAPLPPNAREYDIPAAHVPSVAVPAGVTVNQLGCAISGPLIPALNPIDSRPVRPPAGPPDRRRVRAAGRSGRHPGLRPGPVPGRPDRPVMGRPRRHQALCVSEVVVTTEPTRCVECGDELAGERAELGYAYCTKEACQKKHYRGLRVTVLGTNKGAEVVVTGDEDEVRRRGEAGELATKDTGLGLNYRSSVPQARPQPQRTTPRPVRATVRRPWTAQQEKLVRLYHDMGLSPGRIAERARRTAPRLGITERLAVQILSAPPGPAADRRRGRNG